MLYSADSINCACFSISHSAFSCANTTNTTVFVLCVFKNEYMCKIVFEPVVQMNRCVCVCVSQDPECRLVLEALGPEASQ